MRLGPFLTVQVGTQGNGRRSPEEGLRQANGGARARQTAQTARGRAETSVEGDLLPQSRGDGIESEGFAEASSFDCSSSWSSWSSAGNESSSARLRDAGMEEILAPPSSAEAAATSGDSVRVLDTAKLLSTTIVSNTAAPRQVGAVHLAAGLFAIVIASLVILSEGALVPRVAGKRKEHRFCSMRARSKAARRARLGSRPA
jgi:hypothetical protein